MTTLRRLSGSRIRWLWVGALAIVAVFALTACGGSDAKEAAAASSESNAPAAPVVSVANQPQQPSGAAAAAAEPGRIYIYADTVIGSKGMTDEEKPLRSCTEQSRFAPGEQLGWRIKVYDSATGDELSDADVASVQIKLGDGQVFDAKYGGHGKPEPTAFFWANFWVIPTDYPTGLLEYTIVATTTDGRTAEFTHDTINIASSMLTIQDRS